MNKKIKLVVIGLLVLLSVGCTNYVKEDKKAVTYEETGQMMVSNILCKPVSENLLNFYQEHNNSLETKLEDLSTCKDFKPSDLGYKGLWESILVKPIAWLILKIGELIGNYGIAVMIMSILIRALMIPITKKSMSQTENMKKVQPEIEKIQKKYQGKQDRASQMAMSQEMMMLYQKYNVKPLSGCLSALIQLPLFFAFLEAINRVPAIFEGSLFGMNLGMTPSVGIAKGNYIYIILIILIIASTYMSFKNAMNSQGNGSQAGQMKFMMIFMLIMISIASLSLPTAIALYWIVNNLFAIVQNKIIQTNSKKDNNKTSKIKSKKETPKKKETTKKVKDAKIVSERKK